MTNASRDLLFALALIAVVAGACNDDGPVSPAAPSPVTAVAEVDSATRAIAAEPETLAGGGPRAAAMNAGTCVSGPGYIRCWHFRPTLVLWVSPNEAWARNGTPFVSHLRSGFKVHCDKTIVWSGGRRIYRVSPARPVTIDGERYTCS